MHNTHESAVDDADAKRRGGERERCSKVQRFNGVSRLGVRRIGVRILPFMHWLTSPCYQTMWISSYDPIYFGLYQFRRDLPSFWMNRPLRVRGSSGECFYGVVRRVAIGDAIRVEWDVGYPRWSDLDFSRDDIELLHPRVSVREVVTQWARQLYTVLSEIPSSIVVVDERDFIGQFVKLVYDVSC